MPRDRLITLDKKLDEVAARVSAAAARTLERDEVGARKEFEAADAAIRAMRGAIDRAREARNEEIRESVRVEMERRFV